jgi:hypothetical protein
MNLRPALALSFVVLAGCATDQGPASTAGAAPKAAAAGTAAFRTADFAWSTTTGSGQIDGQVAYKGGGAAYSCTASGVILTPETLWVRGRMQVLYNSASGAALPADEVRRRTPPERTQDYSNFIKRAKCGPAGEFTFTGLPDGSWYVITVARPTAPATGQEMALMRRVTIKGGKTVKVKL